MRPSRLTIIGCRLGSQRRRARFRFIPTDCGFQPVIGFLPQISHTRAIQKTPVMNEPAHRASASPERGDPSTLGSGGAIGLPGMSVSTAVHPLAAGDLDRPIRAVLPELARGASALGRLGVATPRDALFYLPFRYDDFSELRPRRRPPGPTWDFLNCE